MAAFVLCLTLEGGPGEGVQGGLSWWLAGVCLHLLSVCTASLPGVGGAGAAGCCQAALPTGPGSIPQRHRRRDPRR